MGKGRYLRKLWLKATAILLLPSGVFLLVMGKLFPLDSAWEWFRRIMAELSVWTLFLAGITQLLESSLPEWIGWDLLHVWTAFETTTDITLRGVSDTLPVLRRRVNLRQTEGIKLQLARTSLVLLAGESGTGKSGIAAELVRSYGERGVPVLFVDARNYSDTVVSFGQLADYVGVAPPLRDRLGSVARKTGECLLVIDQLDSIIGTPAFQVSVELLASAAGLGQVRAVGISSDVDPADYDRLVRVGFVKVSSSLLDRQTALDLLTELGVLHPSDGIIALARNLFILSLVAQLSTETDLNQAVGETALLEEYRRVLNRSTEGRGLVSASSNLAYRDPAHARSDFPRPEIPDDTVARLVSRGVLKRVGRGLYRFRHEQLLYYFYACRAIDSGSQPREMLARVAGCHLEGALVWILRLFSHRQSKKLKEFLAQALTGTEELSFYEKASLLDELQSWDSVGLRATVVNTVLGALDSSPSLEYYFYRHLADSKNTRWFEPLRLQGAFVGLGTTGGAARSELPILGYLAAIASEVPEGFVEIVGHLETPDPNILHRLATAARDLPPRYAARVVPYVVAWCDHDLRPDRNVVDLALALTQGDEWEAALTLVDLLLSPRRRELPDQANALLFPRAEPKANTHVVQRLVESGLSLFIETHPLDVMRLLEKNLEAALEIEGQDVAAASIGWRRAIEPHEQNWGAGELRNLLVDAAVGTLDHIIDTEADRGRQIVREYLRRPRSIYRRLAIHAIREHYSVWPDLVERLFTDPRYLEKEENRHIYHEYWMLMHDVFPTLPEPIQARFLEQLLGKLPQEQRPEDETYLRERCWVLRRLLAVKDCLETEEQRTLLKQLLLECGESGHPSFLSYTTTDWHAGSRSPRTAEELIGMPDEGLIVELRKNPPSDGFGRPDAEGLASALRSAISQEPDRFERVAPQLFGSDIAPIYTYHALWGFREAWKQQDFNWEPVLSLCEEVAATQEPVDMPGEAADLAPGYWQTTYASARRAVATLIEVGAANDDKAIPPHLLPRARDVLLLLADDPNPSPEYEKRRLAESLPHGPLTVSLNVIRAEAIEVLLTYALHIARKRFPPTQDEAVKGSKLERVVRDKLTERLDPRTEPSLAVHSVFGRYLPNSHYLDEEWLTANLERILPRQPELEDYWEAAWDGYMFRGDFFGPLYEKLLRPYYHYAIEKVAVGAEGKAGSTLSQNRLAHHLAALYWRGIETLDSRESGLVLFLNTAPDELRATFISSIGNALRESQPDADSEQWARAKTLWLTRYQTITSIVDEGAALSDHLGELAAYVRWVPGIPGDLKEFYPMIQLSAVVSDESHVHELLEFFATKKPDGAVFVSGLLEDLLKQDHRPGWFLSVKRQLERDISDN